MTPRSWIRYVIRGSTRSWIPTRGDHNFKEKGKLGLRAKLRADEQRKQSATINVTDLFIPTPTFKSLMLGQNLAVNEKILRGHVLIFSRIFNKVDTQRATTKEVI